NPTTNSDNLTPNDDSSHLKLCYDKLIKKLKINVNNISTKAIGDIGEGIVEDHEQKKLNTFSRYDEEARNLEAKRAIVQTIKNLDKSLDTDKALSALRELMDQWYSIGHVPYKLKDITYREFYDATEEQFDRLNIDKTDRKLESFKTNISDLARSGNAKNQLYHEREKLMRQYDRMKNELQTYENNIGFLSVSSKKGNHLLDDMNSKVEKIKSELQLIIRKIEAVDKEL
ncbi:MAG: DUF349 domain-containing protein, partial [Bacteroidales bacterium]